MGHSEILYYDDSFEGFLTACGKALVESTGSAVIQKIPAGPEGFFPYGTRVKTDRECARAVWTALGQKGAGHQRLVYFSFLSERPGLESKILARISQVFDTNHHTGSAKDRDPEATLIRWAGKVENEWRRLEAELTFQNPRDEFFTGLICPQHNVLPLLSRQFRIRFRGRPWLVYDNRRHLVLWSSEGAAMFLEKIGSCPSEIRSLIAAMRPLADLLAPGASAEFQEPIGLGKDLRYRASTTQEGPSRVFRKAV